MIKISDFKRLFSLASAMLLLVSSSLLISSCGGEEPDAPNKDNGELENPDKPSDEVSVPLGFTKVTLTQTEGQNEIDLGWGILTLNNSGRLGMKDGIMLNQTVFRVAKMSCVSDIKKALSFGYPEPVDDNYNKPSAGYGYLARGRRKYARLYVTNVEYSPMRVTLVYEPLWTSIPENSYIEPNCNTVYFGQGAFSSANVAEREVGVVAPLGYELVSKPEFVSEVVCEKSKMIIRADISKYPLPKIKRSGEVVVANEWCQSRVFVEYGADFY